jgi:uncharacterized protein (DUF2164 family)
MTESNPSYRSDNENRNWSDLPLDSSGRRNDFQGQGNPSPSSNSGSNSSSNPGAEESEQHANDETSIRDSNSSPRSFRLYNQGLGRTCYSAKTILDRITDEITARPMLALGIVGGVAALGTAAISRSRITRERTIKGRLADMISRFSSAVSEVGEQTYNHGSDAAGTVKKKVSDKSESLERMAKELLKSANEMGHEIEELGVEGARLISSKVQQRPILAGCLVGAAFIALATAYYSTGSTATTSSKRAASRRTRDNRPYEERSRDELYQMARDSEIEGRSTMSKDELISALRGH